MSSSPAESLVRIEARDSATWVVLSDTPSSQIDLATELSKALATLRRDADLRCVVITGEGAAFADGELQDPDAQSTTSSVLTALVSQLRSFRVPTICASNADAIGIGAVIALCCDLCVAIDRATFLFSDEGRLRSPIGGLSWILPRVVGRSRAMDLLLTRRRLSAADALAWGLIAKVVPSEDLDSTVTEMTAAFAQVERSVLGAVKRAINYSQDVDFDEAIEFERLLGNIPVED